MIKKSDWDAIEDELLADDRRTLGEPPTNEELLAYSRGELTPEEEARVRALLVAYPELARAVAVPFPADGGDALSPDEVSRRWKSFEARVPPRGKVLQFWRASAALAAGLALVFGGLLWRETTDREPQVLGESYQLVPGGQRGAGNAVVVGTGKEPMVLIVPLAEAHYRLEIVGADARVLWRSGIVTPGDDGAFRIELPRGFLDPGRYSVVLYRVDGTGEHRVDMYPLHVQR